MTKQFRLGPIVGLALVVGSVVLALGSRALSAAQRETREQHAFVTVLDPSDAPMSGLTPSAFVVREDGLAREVLRVAPAAPPSHLVLLVDDSESTEGMTLELRAALKSFVTALPPAAPGPIMRLATFGDRPTTRVEFTTTPSSVFTAIDQIFPKTGSGGTLLEALVDTCRDLKTRGATRPMIVAFVSESGVEFSTESHTRIADALRAVGASFWSVVLEDRRGQNLSEANRERASVLGDVLRQSGGINKVVLSKQGLESAAKFIAAAIKGQLDVTYGRLETMVPPRKLQVTLRQGGGRVVASEWVHP